MNYTPRKEYRLADETIELSEIDALRAWLATNPWLTQHTLVPQFEDAYAAWLGAKHACYVNSGSSANLLMYYAPLVSGKLKNRKVVVPAVSWATSVMPAMQLGFEPLMCEADEQTFGLDVEHLENLVKKHQPSMVLLVHLLGTPCRMDELLALKQKYGFLLLEDACAAMGSRYAGRKVGTFGDFSTFSFYYGHHASTIEGGMICTNDAEMHEVLTMLRAHGWAKDISAKREAARAKEVGALEFNRPFTFYYPGFNVRATDLQAKIGLEQLKKLDKVVARRAENHSIYNERFRGSKDFHIQSNTKAETSSISFCALAKSPEHREKVAFAMRAKGIETRPIGGGNMSRQPFWKAVYGTQVFPMADRVHDTGMQMPNHPILSPEDIDYICDVVLSVKS